MEQQKLTENQVRAKQRQTVMIKVVKTTTAIVLLPLWLIVMAVRQAWDTNSWIWEWE